MKWNAVKEGQKVVLQQDLCYFDTSKVEDYSYMTRAELNACITVSFAAGTELTFHTDGESGILTDLNGDIGVDALDAEVDQALYLVILD
jgi:hypothetical protein